MNDRSSRISFKYLTTIIIVAIISIAFASLEYNYILFDSLPYREAQQPVIGIFHVYQLLIFIPTIALMSFQPFIYQALSGNRSSGRSRKTLALGVASLLLGLILEDAVWFLHRLLIPLPTDPLANQWIRPSDYTATVLGYAKILGTIIPLWYLILTPPIIAIIMAITLIPNS